VGQGERPILLPRLREGQTDLNWRKARFLATLIANYKAALPPGGWPNWVLGNHDRPRVAAMLLLLTLRGTPTLHYGDELGLSDVAIPPAQVQDPRELREPGPHVPHQGQCLRDQ
jgi:alpha-glucosidase